MNPEIRIKQTTTWKIMTFFVEMKSKKKELLKKESTFTFYYGPQQRLGSSYSTNHPMMTQRQGRHPSHSSGYSETDQRGLLREASLGINPIPPSMGTRTGGIHMLMSMGSVEMGTGGGGGEGGRDFSMALFIFQDF